MSASWFDLPLEIYLQRRVDWINHRAKENPILAIVIGYEGYDVFLRSCWTREYYENLIRKVKQ